MEDLNEYLAPTRTIESDSRPIVEKARQLTASHPRAEDKAVSLFYFVRDQIKYTMYVQITREEDYKATTTLARGNGYCGHKAVLMTALARAAGIPARLKFADLENHKLPQKYIEMQGTNLTVYHGFLELYLNGRWLTVDPAYDQVMCAKNRLVPVEFDGEHDATLHPLDQDGNPDTTCVRIHGPFRDLPHAEIIRATKEAYGQDFFETWGQHAKNTTPPSS